MRPANRAPVFGRHVLIMLAALCAIASVSAADITLSKDSLRCQSASSGEVTDFVIFTNGADYEITSDSMILSVSDADADFMARLGSSPPQVTMSLNNNYWGYTLERRGPATFKLNGTPIRTYPDGGNNLLTKLMVGYGLGTASVSRPERMTGTLTVYFLNGEQVVVRLYTNAPVRSGAPRPHRGTVTRGGAPAHRCGLDGRRVSVLRGPFAETSRRAMPPRLETCQMVVIEGVAGRSGRVR